RLEQLRADGVNPYPAQTKRTHTCAAALASFDGLAQQQSTVVIAGRVRAIRGHGKSTFLTIEDASERLQAYVKQDAVGASAYVQVGLLDVGDFVEVEGTAFRTKSGEASILAQRLAVLTKSLEPLPEKWHGLTDTEIRYRHRELDLIANPEVRATAIRRSTITDAVRTFFRDRGFLEVDTPILQSIPGGANARPFVTHHHALGEDLYLRIAPELYLKRLVVGGLERVFEFARCFRNEGIDRNHNPEFTQIEAYQAYASYRDFMELIEALFLKLATETLSGATVRIGDHTIALTPPFPRRSFRDLVLEASGIDITQTDDDALRDALRRLRVEADASWSRGKLLDELYKETARPKIIQPTFVIDHPVELSPLSKRRPEDPTTVERFQLVIAGLEVVNAFSELNDPIDQRERFEEQQSARTAGDMEAMPLDEDFLHALEIGLPPTAGLGLGIDRLVMLLTGSSNLKEVILFPTLRRPPPRHSEDRV
ncbi:lysine--tRNA ligase, partial [Candidatus Uhrbacteria bacterium]|nr:lysine--tRNA ligase [Candidatus Uhrbacteria bacterium]